MKQYWNRVVYSVGALLVLALLYTGAAWYVGGRIAVAYQQAVRDLSRIDGALLHHNYSRGWFRSEVTALVDTGVAMKNTSDEVPVVSGQIHVQGRIWHGPLVLGGGATFGNGATLGDAWHPLLARGEVSLRWLGPHFYGARLSMDSVHMRVVVQKGWLGAVTGDFALAAGTEDALAGGTEDATATALTASVPLSSSSTQAGADMPWRGHFRFGDVPGGSALSLVDGEWSFGTTHIRSQGLQLHVETEGARGLVAAPVATDVDEATAFAGIGVHTEALILIENGAVLLSLRDAEAKVGKAHKGEGTHWQVGLQAADMRVAGAGLGRVTVHGDVIGGGGEATGRVENHDAPMSLRIRGQSSLADETLQLSLSGGIVPMRASRGAPAAWHFTDGTRTHLAFSTDYLARIATHFSRTTPPWLRAVDHAHLLTSLVQQGYLQQRDSAFHLMMERQNGEWLIGGDSTEGASRPLPRGAPASQSPAATH